jgi:hypothetical protein
MNYGKILSVASNGNTDFTWNGGTGMFAAAGSTWASAKLTLQHKVGDTYVDIGSDAVFDAANGQTLFTTASRNLRIVTASISGTPNVIAEVVPITETPAY